MWCLRDTRICHCDPLGNAAISEGLMGAAPSQTALTGEEWLRVWGVLVLALCNLVLLHSAHL